MKKIKIIDLFNKIANMEKVPEKIRFRKNEYTFIGGSYEDVNRKELLNDYWACQSVLNDTAEIIEEVSKGNKEIEKIDIIKCRDGYLDEYGAIEIVSKIDELIDVVNELKRGK